MILGKIIPFKFAWQKSCFGLDQKLFFVGGISMKAKKAFISTYIYFFKMKRISLYAHN